MPKSCDQRIPGGAPHPSSLKAWPAIGFYQFGRRFTETRRVALPEDRVPSPPRPPRLPDPAPVCILRRSLPTLPAPHHLHGPSQTPNPSLAALPHLAPALRHLHPIFFVPSQTPPLHLTTCAPPTPRPCTPPRPSRDPLGGTARGRGGGAGPISWNQSRRPPPPPPCPPAEPPRTSSFVTMFFKPVKQTVQLEPGPPASIFADV